MATTQLQACRSRLICHRVARGPVLIALISSLFAAVLVLNVTTLLAPPHLSLVLTTPHVGQVRVAWLLPGSMLWDRGIRRGDHVILLDGHPPSSHDVGVWIGRRVAVHTPAGRIITADVAVERPSPATWPLLALSPWFALLGTLVVLRAPHPAIGRATYALFISAAFALALAPSADHDEPVGTVSEFIMVAVFALSFVQFFLTFPTQRGTRRLRALLIVPPLVGIALGLLALLWPALYAVGSFTRIAVLCGYLLLGAGLLISSFIVIRDREAQRGLTMISVGTTISVLPFVLLYLLPTLLHLQPIVSSEQAILTLPLLPASFAYAILRHRVLNIHLLQRWLVRGLLWAGMLAVYGVAVYSLRRWPRRALTEPRSSTVFAIVLIPLIGLTFRWLHDLLSPRLDRLIFKDAYDYRTSLQQLSRDLSLVGDLETLGASLPATLCRLMNLEFAVLLVNDETGVRPVGGTGTYDAAMAPALTAPAC